MGTHTASDIHEQLKRLCYQLEQLAEQGRIVTGTDDLAPVKDTDRQPGSPWQRWMLPSRFRLDGSFGHHRRGVSPAQGLRRGCQQVEELPWLGRAVTRGKARLWKSNTENLDF
jgi:hypothetical protein